MRNRLEQQFSDYNCERCALDSRESNVADGLLGLEGVRKIEVIEQERRAVSYLRGPTSMIPWLHGPEPECCAGPQDGR